MSRTDLGFHLANDSDDPGLKCTSQGLSLARAPLKAAYGEGIDPAGLMPGLSRNSARASERRS